MNVPLRDGSHIHLLDIGSPSSDPPFLLLHGFTGSSGAWGRPLLQRLAAERRVIALDLPGHGASAAPAEPRRYAFAAVIADLADVLDALDVPQAVWIGYSMGGRLALGAGLLLRDRVARLVLESASPGLERAADRRARRGTDETLARSIESDGLKAFVERWERQPLFTTQRALPESTRAAIRARRLSNRPEALAACLRGLGAGMQPSLWSALEHVDVPALLVAGSKDEKFVALNGRMEKALPHARLRVVPGAGHAVHLEDPETWLSAVLDFVAGTGGR